VNFDAAFDAAVVSNEPKLSKFVHKEAHAGSGRSDHLRKGFLADLGDNRSGLLSLPKFANSKSILASRFSLELNS
jgi:hypothetical protein